MIEASYYIGPPLWNPLLITCAREFIIAYYPPLIIVLGRTLYIDNCIKTPIRNFYMFFFFYFVFMCVCHVPIKCSLPSLLTSWQGHHDRVMQLNWLYFCSICQMMPLKVGPNTALGCYHQSICMPQLQPLRSAALVIPRRDEGSGNPVQWSKPYSILAPLRIRTRAGRFRIISGDHYTTTEHKCRISGKVFDGLTANISQTKPYREFVSIEH